MTHDEIINDVHSKILKEWTVQDQDDFFLSPWIDGSSLTRYHHDLGRYIRNNYKLWEISWIPEIKEFMGCMCDCSPYHPDAVSMTIIKEVWKKGLYPKN